MTLQITHIVNTLQEGSGSVAISLRGLFDRLREKGVGTQVVELDQVSAGDLSGLASSLQNCNLVHFHGWGTRVERAAAGVVQSASIPHLIAPHGSLYSKRQSGGSLRKRLFSGWSTKRAIKRAAALVAINEKEKSQFLEFKAHERVVSLPLGLCRDDYAGSVPNDVKLPEAPDGNLILVLSPLHPVEGIIPLLLSLAELAQLADGWSVVVAGPQRGNWRKMLEAAIQRKGAQGRVRFYPADDIITQRAWLSRASLVVAPRLEIGNGISVLQAAASGVPVIAAEASIPTGFENAVFSYGSARHELKKELRLFFERSEQERNEGAEKAKAIFAEQADWSVLVDDYVALYQEWA